MKREMLRRAAWATRASEGSSSFLQTILHNRLNSVLADQHRISDEQISSWHKLPPVTPSLNTIGENGGDSTQGITALKWVMKCCPELPHCLIRKLFRQRKVRISPSEHICSSPSDSEVQLKKVADKLVLKEGSILHIPHNVVKERVDRKEPGIDQSKKRVDKASKAELEWLRELVLYKDNNIIIVNKPSGLAVQGGTKVGKNLDSLMEAAYSYDYSEGPRLVHRLDKEASGLMVLGRTFETTSSLHMLLREKSLAAAATTETTKKKDCAVAESSMDRRYWALVIGKPKDTRGIVSGSLVKVLLEDGKSERILVDKTDSEKSINAVTEYKVLGPSVLGCTWLELRPLTGRKHQIRVHCAQILGTPIMGDEKYGRRAHKNWHEKFVEMAKKSKEFEFGEHHLDGSMLSAKPLLHLHSRKMIIPNNFRHNEHQNRVRNKLTFTAPLPPHMEASWGLLPVPGLQA